MECARQLEPKPQLHVANSISHKQLCNYMELTAAHAWVVFSSKFTVSADYSSYVKDHSYPSIYPDCQKFGIILIGLYMAVGGVAETIFCQQSACTGPLLILLKFNVWESVCMAVWMYGVVSRSRPSRQGSNNYFFNVNVVASPWNFSNMHAHDAESSCSLCVRAEPTILYSTSYCLLHDLHA